MCKIKDHFINDENPEALLRADKEAYQIFSERHGADNNNYGRQDSIDDGLAYEEEMAERARERLEMIKIDAAEDAAYEAKMADKWEEEREWSDREDVDDSEDVGEART